MDNITNKNAHCQKAPRKRFIVYTIDFDERITEANTDNNKWEMFSIRFKLAHLKRQSISIDAFTFDSIKRNYMITNVLTFLALSIITDWNVCSAFIYTAKTFQSFSVEWCVIILAFCAFNFYLVQFILIIDSFCGGFNIQHVQFEAYWSHLKLNVMRIFVQKSGYVFCVEWMKSTFSLLWLLTES